MYHLLSLERFKCVNKKYSEYSILMEKMCNIPATSLENYHGETNMVPFVGKSSFLENCAKKSLYLLKKCVIT